MNVFSERTTSQDHNLLDLAGSMISITTKMQSEFLRLYSQRATAYLGLYERLSQGKEPSQILAEQVAFLNDMQRHYADAVRRMLSAASPVQPGSIAPGVEKSASDAEVAQPNGNSGKDGADRPVIGPAA